MKKTTKGPERHDTRPMSRAQIQRALTAFNESDRPTLPAPPPCEEDGRSLSLGSEGDAA